MRPSIASLVTLFVVSLSMLGCSSEETVVSESKFNLGTDRTNDTLTVTITALNATKHTSTNPNGAVPLKSRQRLSLASSSVSKGTAVIDVVRNDSVIFTHTFTPNGAAFPDGTTLTGRIDSIRVTATGLTGTTAIRFVGE